MRRQIDPNAPDQTYTVMYNACWPDGSCHDGSFQFAIDRTKAQSFEDQTGKKEVTIKMSQIKFMPMDLKVSKGTKITWVNDESIEHYVNTDSHPAHTYYLDQNSKALKKGEKYSLTFEGPGIYPYHCSAHAANMTGNILVQ
jgi:plastocyanin